MHRLTQKNECGVYRSEELPQVILDRLALYENAHCALLDEMAELPPRLEALRAQGREKTVQFRELFAKKLTLSGVLSFFQAHGLTF